MARQLEQLARQKSSPELAEAALRLKQAQEAMRQSAGSRDARGLNQASEATAALEDARRLLERNQNNQLGQSAENAEARANDIAARQQRIEDAVERLPTNANERRAAIPAIIDQKEALAEDLRGLEADLRRLSGEASGTDAAAERAFREAATTIREGQLPERVDYSQSVVARSNPQLAEENEQDLTDRINAVREQVQQAARSASSGAEQQNAGSELAERTADLLRGAQAMEARAQAAQQGQGQQGQGQQGQGQQGQGQQGQGQQGQGQQGQGQQGQGQQGQGEQGQGQQGQGQQGGQQGGGNNQGGRNNQGGGGPGSISADVGRQLQSEAGARRLQAEGIRDQLRELGLVGGEFAEMGERLDEVIDQFGTLEQARAYADARALADVQSLLIESLRELDFEIRRQLTPTRERGPITAGSGAVPEEYREMVEEYFRSLARP
jgi:hypothetical protein